MDRIVIRTGGGVARCLYTEKVNLRRLIGPALTVERASNVEYDNARGGWVVTFPGAADGWALHPLHLHEEASVLALDERGRGFASLLRSRGSVFASREEALGAEVDFLQAVLTAGSYGTYLKGLQS